MATKKPAAVADRKTQLLDVGAKLASKHGHTNVTRRMVAVEAKVSEALVSSYLGDSKTAQAAYKRRATKLGLKLPTAAQAEEMGAKLRAHGPRKNPVVRKRSAKEVKAIKEKLTAPGAVLKARAAKKLAGSRSAATTKKSAAPAAKSAPRSAKPKSTTRKPGARTMSEAVQAATGAPVIEQPKTAARAPKAPPTLPPLPLPLLPTL